MHHFHNGLTLFLILAPFAVSLIVPPVWIRYALIAPQLAALLWLYKINRQLFLHSFFWTVFYLSQSFILWPLSFILPLLLYGAYFLVRKDDRGEITWFRKGRIDRITLAFMFLVIAGTSAVLFLWLHLSAPDLSDLKSMLPAAGPVGLIIMGLLFSIFNAVWEEFIFRGILWNALEKMGAAVFLINVLQAILFGILHIGGFPRGITGALLAGFYGLIIGFFRQRSEGMAVPVIVHFFADATIFALLISISL